MISTIKKDFFIFCFISSIGLSIDFFIYHSFFLLTNNILLSNGIGGLAAITFVYLCSGFFLIKKRNDSLYSFISWLLLMVISIALFSYLIKTLFIFLGNHLFAKFLITPFSLLFNYGCWNLIKKYFLNRPI